MSRVEETHPMVVFPRDERMAFWHVGTGVRGGFVAASLYLITGQGDGPLNQALLFKAGAAIHTLAKPFVVGADWQMEPDMVTQGWLSYVGGKVCASGRPTCISNTCQSEIDFFVIGKGLDSLCRQVNVLDGVSVRPHRPVCVSAWLDGKAPRKSRS
jgi:hypothetical protein